jgi:8-oxo-dGTP pyrophosphatase MutT (NUDIX family)
VEQRKILSPGRFDYLTSSFVAERLAASRQGRRGDHGAHPPARPVPAAVLVPLIERGAELTVLLTQRTQHLTDHAGQIAFPGGRVEPGDADAVATALRETEEEVGLPGERVRVVGRLDTYLTSTGYTITPVVGLIRPPFPVEPDPFEVAEVFEVPLAFIVDPANHQRHAREYQGRRREFYVLPYGGRYIWGATAGMLVNLAQLLARDEP